MCSNTLMMFFIFFQMVFISNPTSMGDILPAVVEEMGLVTLVCTTGVEEETVGVTEVTTGSLLGEAVMVRVICVLWQTLPED